jgi:hypothetical protein
VTEGCPPLHVQPFTKELAPGWDRFVAESKNGTFLFQRGYMDYHADRFTDASLVLEDAAGQWLALLPASRDGARVSSHGGLTYGGLVSADSMTTPRMLAAFDAIRAHYSAEGVTSVHYKTIPHPYHRLPAEEDRYALFRQGATLVRRDVLSVVEPTNPGPVQSRRRRAAAKAAKAGVVVRRSTRWPDYWRLLAETLAARHAAAPVHSLDEIALLARRFPDQITLWLAELEGEPTAGVVVYDTGPVAHAQYTAANELGRETGSLDLLFLNLIGEAYRDRKAFDFGISNEDQGRVLNSGLIEQKEGFGARAVVHDFYDWRLA